MPASIVAWRRPLRRSSAVISSSPTYFSRTFSSCWDTHVDELVAPRLGVVLHVGGDVDGLVLLAHAVVPDQRLHLEQVDDAAELALGADRQLDDRGLGVEAVLDHVDGSGRSRRRCGPSC